MAVAHEASIFSVRASCCRDRLRGWAIFTALAATALNMSIYIRVPGSVALLQDEMDRHAETLHMPGVGCSLIGSATVFIGAAADPAVLFLLARQTT